MTWQSDRMRSELKKLVRSTCANYGSNGKCLISELECYVCRELTLDTQQPWRCRWFEEGVLPNDSKLEAEYRKALADYLGVDVESGTTIATCKRCKKDFTKSSRNEIYCKACKVEQRRKTMRENKRKQRAKKSQ